MEPRPDTGVAGEIRISGLTPSLVTERERRREREPVDVWPRDHLNPWATSACASFAASGRSSSTSASGL